MSLVQAPRCECRVEDGLCPEEAEVSCYVCRDEICRKHASIRGDGHGGFIAICKPSDDDRACGTALELRHTYIFDLEAVK